MFVFFVFFSSRRRHTRCALVTGVQTCALPISDGSSAEWVATFEIFAAALERHLKAEESDLIPLCRLLFNNERAEALGERFERHKRNELALWGHDSVADADASGGKLDRKSTRLTSSH